MNAKEIIEKYDLENLHWSPKQLQGNLHTFFLVSEEAINPLREYYGDAYSFTICFVKDHMIYWFWNDDEMERLRISFVKKMNENPEILTELQNEWEQRLDVFDNTMREIDETDLSTLSDEKLLSLYRKWYAAYLAEYGISIGIQDAFSIHADRFLEPHFKAIITEDFAEKFALLTSPVTDTFLAEEEKDLLTIMAMEKRGEDMTAALEAHSKKWHWLRNNYHIHRILGPNDFKKQMEKFAGVDSEEKIKEIDNQLEQIKQNKAALLKELNLDQESLNLIKITEVFAYIQDKRKSYVMIATHYEALFMEEARKRLGLTRKEIEYTYMYEWPELFKGKIDKELLAERAKFCCLFYTPEGPNVLVGNEAEKLFAVFNKDVSDQTEVSGMVASHGKAKGKVRIVSRSEDVAAMQEGEVLVTSMTRPEMVVAMKKAVAIVTNEGGVTSHAAVVSRELKIPCVIGTKHATDVFSDGDLVEVDAEKGVVRKVK